VIFLRAVMSFMIERDHEPGEQDFLKQKGRTLKTTALLQFRPVAR